VVSKFKHGVLKFFEISAKYINLTDLGGDAAVTLWKAADVSGYQDTLTEQLSPFAKAFRAASEEALSKAALDLEADRVREMNSVHPGKLSEMNETDPEAITRDAPDPGLVEALMGLRQVDPEGREPAHSRFLESVTVGASGQNYYSMLESNAAPRSSRDFFLEALLAGGGRELPGREVLGPGGAQAPADGGREPRPNERQRGPKDNGQAEGWRVEQRLPQATVEAVGPPAVLSKMGAQICRANTPPAGSARADRMEKRSRGLPAGYVGGLYESMLLPPE